ncbi:similar to Saccharomyces cerevisiae YNL253W TEX1 Protein involved in mRNA export, component of the transcription export (TREX) complex [Maudiozyma barnettii]|uniref:Similar to Saccharomyces cerevisiae YNL253W TEX1 Protein involved in mRNA export, component of the transcription export (TREX) complex n=1 Tax=Maudiozyma barnettii TaxID=61262 RepID=A0A8H2VE08_9SACH|nr:Tex1p [Kazachstania barnettii]CAB4253827.1 similar to Saccharomyces cerevisiae YNL253W TEX1 Protein involved in mRNA export, component of the transcription export (TREX) complex [Kazachstania barnettii]CAD1781576.1 similar to Saccharomyces cerevisiae YNL253W TEX1 Protein involved in mRNA export, component of the transcription export (TREX) complex [Kazachstania barnettii]
MSEDQIKFLEKRSMTVELSEDITKAFLLETQEKKNIENIEDERYTHVLTHSKSRFAPPISPNEIITLKFHHSGNYFAYSRVDGSLNIWNFPSGSGRLSREIQYTYVRDCVNSERVATDLSWNPQETNQLAAASNSNEILIWNHDASKKTIVKLKTLFIKSFKTKINQCLYDPTGKWLLGTTKQELLYLFNVRNEYSLDLTYNLWEKLGFQSSITSISWNNSGSHIFLGLKDGKIIILQIKQNNDVLDFDLVFEIDAHRSSINNLKMDPCGRFVVAGSADGTCSVWDTINLSCIHVITDLNAAVVSLDVNNLGKVLAICTGDDNIFFYDTNTFKMIEQRTVEFLRSDAIVKFHPNRSWYVLSSKGDTLQNYIASSDDELKYWKAKYENNLHVVRNGKSTSNTTKSTPPSRGPTNRKVIKSRDRHTNTRRHGEIPRGTRYSND